MTTESPALPDQQRKIIVVGAGAIGSYALGYLARLTAIGEITIVDRDIYDPSNLRSQNIIPRDIGRPKAEVQARRLIQDRPGLQTRAIVEDVKSVPLGMLRGDVILSCVDSPLARLYINQSAFRLGVPWIDAGVQADGLLARIHVFASHPEAACLECGWSERDYSALDYDYPCSGPSRFPTNAPAALGALAAALQALELQKFINGHRDRLAVGRQVVVDAMWHKHRVTEFPRNPRCRFDHQTWRVETIDCGPHELTLGQAFELGRGAAAASEPLHFRVERKHFVTKLSCPACGLGRGLLRLEGSLSPRRCSRCGRPMAVAPFGLNERIERDALPKKLLARSLRDIGLQPGEIYTIGAASRDRHFEITSEGGHR